MHLLSSEFLLMEAQHVVSDVTSLHKAVPFTKISHIKTGEKNGFLHENQTADFSKIRFKML